MSCILLLKSWIILFRRTNLCKSVVAGITRCLHNLHPKLFSVTNDWKMSFDWILVCNEWTTFDFFCEKKKFRETNNSQINRSQSIMKYIVSDISFNFVDIPTDI